MRDTASELSRLAAERILILDGAMGTALQRAAPTPADFHGERFAGHSIDLTGNHDALSLTKPELVRQVHADYLAAGADIIETNTFSAQTISMADYGLESEVRAMNIASARLAREAIEALGPGAGPRFVAGAVGPTNVTLSMSPDVDRPGYRAKTFEQMRAAYAEQIEALFEGGVDLILLETIFDTLNAKAAIAAYQDVSEAAGRALPLMISVTITDRSGRTLSGQTIEAFWISVAHARPWCVGLNCALGPAEMRPFLRQMHEIAPLPVSCYPNAGLPNEFGGYDLGADEMAAIVAEFAQDGWLNLVGGCCGSGPEHIRAIAGAVRDFAPRAIPERTPWPVYAGLEALTIRPEANFVLVGERTNVTGSRRFARLVREERYEEAVAVARSQVAGGANMLDVNMDEGMLDSAAAMGRFLRILATEPDVARIPFVIDSSKFEVIEAGLRCVQGKALVNSISLKEGEAAFLHQARRAARYGAGLVVMAFDEEGQATSIERKVSICERAYKLLTERAKIAPTDIVFDANILTVATGMPEHDEYAINFIEAVRRIRAACPGAQTIGGVSNVSFSFRGNNAVREAIHAAFLYRAIEAGLSMGIVNAGQLAVYDEIEPELRERVDDVLLARNPEATERLIEYAAGLAARDHPQQERAASAWRSLALAERLRHALVHGIADHMPEDLDEALAAYPRPLDIIEGPLMDGMRVVGDLFGDGKMFLPQVVKSARAMKKGVAHLLPHMEDEDGGGAPKTQGTIVLATVKGDVHDIGKNIVGVVLRCNNYEVIDLGVMVPCERILAEAIERDADLVGLSGLITPSLDEMVYVAKEMERARMRAPLLIGGATTSRKHTSIKIAPHYGAPVAHVLDAARVTDVAGSLLAPGRRAAWVAENREVQERDRERYGTGRRQPLLSLEEARARRFEPDWDSYEPPRPAFLGARDLAPSLETLAAYIDWTPFFITWGFRDVYPRLLEDERWGEAARELFDHARRLLDQIVSERWLEARGVYGFFEARRDGDDIELGARRARLCMLRQQRIRPGEEQPNLSLSDFVSPSEGDSIGAFAVSAGFGLEEAAARFEADHDDYNAIMIKALADRLAEAFAEWAHAEARRAWGIEESWGADDLIAERYRGIRPAPGYPACPDHTEKGALWELLEVERRCGIRLTESYAMWPGAAVSGWYFAHPEARYFRVGAVGRDQIESYAARKEERIETIERWLAPNLGYEPA